VTPARLEVGRVGRAKGLRGEVMVTLSTNRHERMTAGAVLYSGDRALVIREAHEHQGRWRVQFEGVDDRNAAEALRGAVLTGDPLGDAPEGETWVHDLIGAEVHDRAGTMLGRITSVEDNPAHDLLVLDNGALVPMVFVVEHRNDVIVVELPDGLLDL
jgi:16S rRNA processing protein RimM